MGFQNKVLKVPVKIMFFAAQNKFYKNQLSDLTSRSLLKLLQRYNVNPSTCLES